MILSIGESRINMSDILTSCSDSLYGLLCFFDKLVKA